MLVDWADDLKMQLCYVMQMKWNKGEVGCVSINRLVDTTAQQKTVSRRATLKNLPN